MVCGNYGYMHVFLVCVYCKLLGEDVEWWSGWESGGVCFGEWRRKGAVGEPDVYCSNLLYKSSFSYGIEPE